MSLDFATVAFRWPDSNLIRRLQGLPRFFTSHPGGGQAAEFLIDERQELLGR